MIQSNFDVLFLLLHVVNSSTLFFCPVMFLILVGCFSSWSMQKIWNALFATPGLSVMCTLMEIVCVKRSSSSVLVAEFHLLKKKKKFVEKTGCLVAVLSVY